MPAKRKSRKSSSAKPASNRGGARLGAGRPTWLSPSIPAKAVHLRISVDAHACLIRFAVAKGITANEAADRLFRASIGHD